MAADPPKPAEKIRRSDQVEDCGPHDVGRAGGGEAGDTVTFKVTAKLDPGFHIYKYSKVQGAGGPINTSFDFFDPAGLKVEGDWIASTEPEKHKDPNFADIDSVEYHEDEVTWSIKLKIPDRHRARKKTLRCQARYMVCDAKFCSIPGQWTLPEAVLTVLPGDGKGPQRRGHRGKHPSRRPPHRRRRIQNPKWPTERRAQNLDSARTRRRQPSPTISVRRSKRDRPEGSGRA